MPDITRVVGTWSDGAPLTAENWLKETFHYGRQSGFDGTKGGLEIINGQLDFDGNFNGSQTITSEYVRRETYTQGPHVAGYRQSRDIWYKALFPSLRPIATPDIHEQARCVLGSEFQVSNRMTAFGDLSIDSVLIDITMDYTVASDQRGGTLGTGSFPVLMPSTFVGFIGVWLNGVLYKPSATPIAPGRSSTVEPNAAATVQYFNRADAPDFRTFSMKIRISSEDADFVSLLRPGWHSVAVRVSGSQTIRIHGGAIIATPVR
tara:strand:- start:155 stop:940 length:786 start_codon:yes stop_codon:yes gene_type:complete